MQRLKAPGLSECRCFHMEHKVCSTYTLCFCFFFSFLPTLFFFFLEIKTNQLTCKITVLMFLCLEKFCSMQMVSQTCTGENRRQ